MRRHRFRQNREDLDPEEHATALPIREGERASDFDGRRLGGALKRVPRPDADGFSLPVDGDEDPPLAHLFDSYEEDE